MKNVNKLTNLCAVVALVVLAGCNNMSNTQQRTLSGAAIGTGVGVAGTAMTGGCVSCGAAIGAAAGAGAGYVYDRHKKNNGE